LFTLSVVLPSLKRRRNKAIADQGLVFFGHLRHRSVEDIEAALLDLSQQEVIRQLASQMQVTSKIAWRKHVRLQAALLLLVIAVGAFVIAQTAF
jgi:hypothetical protein